MEMKGVAPLPDTPRELLAGGKIKGGMMAAHISWATHDRPADKVARFWNALPFEMREALGGMILPVKWYEFADLITVDRAIIKTLGGGDITILREVGAHSARLNLTGVYKIYRRDSIHDFLGNGARLHSKFQDFGRAAYLQKGPLAGQMVLSDYLSYSPLYCESALGFYRESLQIHGARMVEVGETTCQCRGAASCTFVLRWQ